MSPVVRFLILQLSALVISMAFAITDSQLYRIPSDVQPAGGGEKATSTNYILSDTIGEPNIGPSASATYDLNAGYRQTQETFFSISCNDSVSLDTITGEGLSTASATCTVISDAFAGYSLSWRVSSGSGGLSTGYLIGQFEDRIAPFSVATPGIPETWSVPTTAAEWGGRLTSSSTDTDNKWGEDGASEKWLNVGTGSYTVVQRSNRTSISGSTEIIQFRVEVGSDAIQPSGQYQTTVTLIGAEL
jgi:hypothetical protein